MYLTKKLGLFWSRWRKEYLSGLREVHQLKNQKPNEITKGDIVLIQDDNLKRGQWKIGIVEHAIQGKDGHIRGAKVRKAGKGKLEFLNRPLQKLFPLESAGKGTGKESKDGEKSQTNQKREEKQTPGREQPYRAAAQLARAKTQLMLDLL